MGRRGSGEEGEWGGVGRRGVWRSGVERGRSGVEVGHCKLCIHSHAAIFGINNTLLLSNSICLTTVPTKGHPLINFG